MLQVRLFGKFTAYRNDRLLEGIGSSKVQALFSYLLLFRERQHVREALAEALWGECLGGQSRKYLRQALWQLQSALELDSSTDHVLSIDAEWVGIDQATNVWLDVAVFEQAFLGAHSSAGCSLDSNQAQGLREAIALYGGDLLPHNYDDWCLYERERLQNMYLSMLDKMMSYCEGSGEFEAGLEYGARSLRIDHARECTHRSLMRLHYLVGDRTGALRQYERCVTALQSDLGVHPGSPTMALEQEIRADRLSRPKSSESTSDGSLRLSDAIDRLDDMHRVLAELCSQVRELEHDIRRLG